MQRKVSTNKSMSCQLTARWSWRGPLSPSMRIQMDGWMEMIEGRQMIDGWMDGWTDRQAGMQTEREREKETDRQVIYSHS